MSTISKENYLKSIFNLSGDSENLVSTSQMAQDLFVTNSAISDMAKKLSSEGLISYEKYKGIELTPEGKKIALNVIRRHRIWELFLMNVLGLKWSEVHDEAERLEHYTSEFLINKMDDFLGNPVFDPHGHPIPRADGSLPVVPKLIRLSEGIVGKRYELIRVDDKDKELIDYLSEIGLLLKTRVEIVSRLEFDKSVTIRFDGKMVNLSCKISDSVYFKEV